MKIHRINTYDEYMQHREKNKDIEKNTTTSYQIKSLTKNKNLQ